MASQQGMHAPVGPLRVNGYDTRPMARISVSSRTNSVRQGCSLACRPSPYGTLSTLHAV